jgi:hypothetical protein
MTIRNDEKDSRTLIHFHFVQILVFPQNCVAAEKTLKTASRARHIQLHVFT